MAQTFNVSFVSGEVHRFRRRKSSATMSEAYLIRFENQKQGCPTKQQTFIFR